MSKKGLIRATRNNRVYAVPTNYVKDSKGNVIKTLYTICTTMQTEEPQQIAHKRPRIMRKAKKAFSKRQKDFFDEVEIAA